MQATMFLSRKPLAPIDPSPAGNRSSLPAVSQGVTVLPRGNRLSLPSENMPMKIENMPMKPLDNVALRPRSMTEGNIRTINLCGRNVDYKENRQVEHAAKPAPCQRNLLPAQRVTPIQVVPLTVDGPAAAVSMDDSSVNISVSQDPAGAPDDTDAVAMRTAGGVRLPGRRIGTVRMPSPTPPGRPSIYNDFGNAETSIGSIRNAAGASTGSFQPAPPAKATVWRSNSCMPLAQSFKPERRVTLHCQVELDRSIAEETAVDHHTEALPAAPAPQSLAPRVIRSPSSPAVYMTQPPEQGKGTNSSVGTGIYRSRSLGKGKGRSSSPPPLQGIKFLGVCNQRISENSPQCQVEADFSMGEETAAPWRMMMPQEVVREVPFPQVQTAEKVIEITRTQEMEKVAPMPQMVTQDVVRQVARPQTIELTKQVPVPQVEHHTETLPAAPAPQSLATSVTSNPSLLAVFVPQPSEQGKGANSSVGTAICRSNSAGKGKGRSPSPPPPPGKGKGKGSLRCESEPACHRPSGDRKLNWRRMKQPNESNFSATVDDYLAAQVHILDADRYARFESNVKLYDSTPKGFVFELPNMLTEGERRKRASELQDLFQVRPAAVDVGKSAAEPVNTLIDRMTLQSLGIVMKALPQAEQKDNVPRKPSSEKEAVDAIILAIRSCDYERVPSDRLETIGKIASAHLQADNNVLRLVEAKGESAVNQLDHPHLHRLIHGVLQIPAFEARVSCMVTDANFHDQHKECHRMLESIRKRLATLQSLLDDDMTVITPVDRFLAIAKYIGNKVNEDSTSPTSNYGFRMKSVRKFSELKFRVRGKEISLFHFIVLTMPSDEVARFCEPSVINDLTEMPITYGVLEPCRQFLHDFWSVRAFVETRKYKGDEIPVDTRSFNPEQSQMNGNDIFFQKMAEFVANNESQADEMGKLVTDFIKQYRAISDYLGDRSFFYPPPDEQTSRGEEETRGDLFQFFGSLAKKIKVAKKEVEALGLDKEWEFLLNNPGSTPPNLAEQLAAGPRNASQGALRKRRASHEREAVGLQPPEIKGAPRRKSSPQDPHASIFYRLSEMPPSISQIRPQTVTSPASSPRALQADIPKTTRGSTSNLSGAGKSEDCIGSINNDAGPVLTPRGRAPPKEMSPKSDRKCRLSLSSIAKRVNRRAICEEFGDQNTSGSPSPSSRSPSPGSECSHVSFEFEAAAAPRRTSTIPHGTLSPVWEGASPPSRSPVQIVPSPSRTGSPVQHIVVPSTSRAASPGRHIVLSPIHVAPTNQHIAQARYAHFVQASPITRKQLLM